MYFGIMEMKHLLNYRIIYALHLKKQDLLLQWQLMELLSALLELMGVDVDG